MQYRISCFLGLDSFFLSLSLFQILEQFISNIPDTMNLICNNFSCEWTTLRNFIFIKIWTKGRWKFEFIKKDAIFV